MEEETATTSFSFSLEASGDAAGPTWLKMQEYNKKEKKKKSYAHLWQTAKDLGLDSPQF